MPDGFIVGGKIQLEAPTNLKTIAANIQKELGNIKVGVDLNIRRGATTQIATMSRNLERLNTVLATTTTQATSAANAINRLADGFNGVLSSSRTFAQSMSQIATHTKTIKNVTSEASDGLASFGRNAELSAKRFLAFGLAAGTIIKFTQAIREGIGEAISFQREMVRLAQVSTEPANEIRSVEATISKLSTTLGVASRELADVAVTFKQAGLSINDTKIALEAVAEASLAPTFTNTKNTVEGAIAAMQQFKLSANDLKGVLGSINQVSADFAVESNDLVTAIQKSGGAFQAAGGNLNELLAVFTSVRQTTRESADTIATGLRTIFARLQRPQTLNDLEQLGIRLRTTREEAEALGNLNLQEQFVGPFEALRRISEGLNGIQQTDPRFAQVVESIGGLRQLSKVVPAIQQFSVAQEALNSALGGTGSLTRSTIQAQDALIIQVTKLREQYNALFRDLIGSKAFNQFASSVLTLASSFATLVDIIKPLLPLLTALTAIKIGSSIGGLLRGFKDFKPLAALGNFLAGRKAEAPVQLKRGGFVPGSGHGDKVPALLEPGEFVLSNPAVNAIGRDKVAGLASGGRPTTALQRLSSNLPKEIQDFIPEGSTLLGSGVEAVAYRTPNGNVVRITDKPFLRSRNENVLQAFKTIHSGKFTAEELPFVPSLDDTGEPVTGLSDFRVALERAGLADIDGHTGNIGKDSSGAFKVIDPGAYLPNKFAKIFDNNSLSENQLHELFTAVRKSGKGFAKGGKPSLTATLGRLLDGASRATHGFASEDIAGPSYVNDRESIKSILHTNAVREAKLYSLDKDPTLIFERLDYLQDLSSSDEGVAKIGRIKEHATRAIYQKLAEKAGLTKDAEPFAIHDMLLDKGKDSLVNKMKSGGLFKGFAKGGSVSDTIPAMLTPGEYVINAESAAQLGDSALNTLNRGKIPGFNKGGWVGMADGGDPGDKGKSFVDQFNEALNLVKAEEEAAAKAAIDELKAARKSRAKPKTQSLQLAQQPVVEDDEAVSKIQTILGAKTAQTPERTAYLNAQIEKFKDVDFDSLDSASGQAFNVGTIEEFEQLLKEANRNKKQIQEYLKAVTAKFSDVNDEVSQLTVSLGTGDAATVLVSGARKDLTEEDKILSDPANRQSPADRAALRKAKFQAAANAAREARIEQETGGILGDTSNVGLRPVNVGRGSRRSGRRDSRTITGVEGSLPPLPTDDTNDEKGLLNEQAQRLGSGIGIIPQDIDLENPLKQTIVSAAKQFTNGISENLKLQPLTPSTPTNFADSEAPGSTTPDFARNPLIKKLTGPDSEKNFNGGPVEVAINRIPQLFDAIGRGTEQALELQKALLGMNASLSATSKVVLDINRETQAVSVLRGVPDKITPLNGQFDAPRGNNNAAFTDAISGPGAERRAEQIEGLRGGPPPDLDARVKDILEGVQLQPLNPRTAPPEPLSIGQILALEQARKSEQNTAKGRIGLTAEEDLQPLPPPPPPPVPPKPTRIPLPVINNPPPTTVFNSLSELENILVRLGKTAPEIAEFTGSLRRFGVTVDQSAAGILKLGTRADGKPTAEILTATGRALNQPPTGPRSFRDDLSNFAGKFNGVSNFFGRGEGLTDEQKAERSGRLAIGASFLGPLIAQAVAPDAAKTDSGAGFLARSAASGGITGASFGAGISGSLGLTGRTAGVVTGGGAAIGIVSALADAERGIREAKLEESVKRLSQKINNVQILGGDGLAAVSASLSEIQQNADSVGRAKTFFSIDPREREKETSNARKLALGGISGQLNQVLQKEGQNLGESLNLTGNGKERRGQAEAVLNGRQDLAPLIESVAEANNVSIQAIRKQLVDAVLTANSRKEQSTLRGDANKINTQSINAISVFTNSVLSANKAVETFQRGLEVIPGLLTGSVGAIAPTSAAGGLDSFGLPNNKDFGKTVNQLLKPFGSLGESVGGTATSFDTIAKVLPLAISNITKTSLDGDNLGSELQQELQRSLGGNLDTGTKQAIAILSDKISDFSLDDLRKRVGTDVSALSTDLLKSAIGPFQAELSNLGKAFDAEQGRIAQNLASFRQLQQEYNQSLEKVVDAQTDAARTSADIQGRRTGQNPLDLFTRADARRPFEQNQANLLRGTGIGNTDAAGIGNELRKVQQDIVSKQSAGVNTREGQQELSSLVTRASNLKQALDSLANTAKRASDIQDRLNDLKRQEDSRGDILERLFTGDARQQFDTTQGLALAGQFRDAKDQKAFALGLSPEDRKLLLQGVGDLGASTGQNLRGQLRNAIGAPLLNPVQNKQVALEDELSTIQKQGIEAQQQNSQTLSVLTETFRTTMENSFAVNAKILADNIQNLTNTINQRRVGEQAAAQGTLNQSRNLLGSGFSLPELQKLKTSPETSKFLSLEEEKKKLTDFNASEIATSAISRDPFKFGGGAQFSFDTTKLQNQLTGTLGADLTKKFLESDQTRFGSATTGRGEVFGSESKVSAELAAQLAASLNKFIADQVKGIGDRQETVKLDDKQKAALQNPEFVKSLQEADLTKLSAAATQFSTSADKFTGSVEQLAQILTNLGPVQNKAGGGSIFKPRGSDTVPAMLTPGEFVVNAEATRKNMALLHQINDGYADGGVVYARKGRRIFGGGNNNFVKPQAIVQQVAALPPAAKKAVAEQLGMPTEQVDLGLGGGNLTTFDTILGSGVNTSSFGNMPQNPIYRANGGITDDVKGNPDLLAVQAQQQAILARVQDEANEALVEQQKFEAQRAREKANAPQAFADNVRALLGERDPNLAVPGTVESGVGPANRVAARPNRAAALFATLRENVRNRQNSQSAASSGNGEFLAQAGLRGDNLQRSIQDQILSGALNDLGTVGSVNTGRRKGVPEDPFAAARRVAARRRTLGNSSIQSSTLIGGKINKFADGGIVPAYLHNGEFVVNKQSTSRNVDLLSNINNNPKHFAQGGPVGSVSPSGGGNSPVFNFDQLSTASEVLQSSIRMFAESSSKLSEALASFPSQISLEGKHTVEVIVNGTQALQGILPEVSQLIEKETKAQINKLLQNKFPDAGQEL